MDMAPDLPTMAEQGYPQFDLVGWFAATVPAETPTPIVEQINGWFAQVLATQETKDFLTGFGSDVWITQAGAGQAFFLKDIETWQAERRRCPASSSNDRRPGALFAHATATRPAVSSLSPRIDLAREHADAVHGVVVLEEAGLAHDQQMAEAADVVVVLLDLLAAPDRACRRT